MLLLPLSPLPQQPLSAFSSLPSSFSKAAMATTETWSPQSLHNSFMTIADDAVTPLSTFLHPETTLSPLNESSELWVRQLVWQDFRLAVAFFVVAPLMLLVWAIAARIPFSEERSEDAETVLRYMTSYWQASSLLLLTVALNVQESNLGVFTGFLAQAMIVVSLFWWEDLNQEIVSISSTPDKNNNDTRTFDIAKAFGIWRLLASISAVYGVGVQAFFQGCNLTPSLADDAYCAPWLEPPKFAASVVGLQESSALGGIASAGCALYSGVLAYYVIVLLPTVGRNGRALRPKLMDFTPIGVWTTLGFLDPPRDRDGT